MRQNTKDIVYGQNWIESLREGYREDMTRSYEIGCSELHALYRCRCDNPDRRWVRRYARMLDIAFLYDHSNNSIRLLR